jgi:hypothetical protein
MPKKPLTLVVLLGFLAASLTNAAEFHVSPSGSSSGNGSSVSPWSLQTALNHPSAVQPGDTIWLHGGTYRGAYRTSLRGTASAPIKVRQYPGERAIIDGGTDTSSGLIVSVGGAYTWYWGFEIMSSQQTRWASTPGSDPPTSELPLAEGTSAGNSTSTPGIKFINLVIHDTRQGVSMWQYASDCELYGIISFNNGWASTDRGHGHGIYMQQLTSMSVDACVSFANFSHGLQAYGSENAPLNGITYQNNTLFANVDREFVLGGGQVADNPRILNNLLYSTGPASQVGYYTGVDNLRFENNYIISYNGSTVLRFRSVSPSQVGSFNNNTIYGDIEGMSVSGLGQNSLLNSKPSANKVVVLPNKYESGRGLVTIYNWSGASSVGVSLSSVLQPNDQFEVRDIQNILGAPVLTGTYSGGTVNFPTDLSAVTPKIGRDIPDDENNYHNVHTSREFNTYLVTKVGGGGATPPPPPPVDQPPALSNLNNVNVANGASTSVQFTVSDDQTPSSALVTRAISSNPALIPNSGLVLSGAATRTLQITPTSGPSGTATITVSVTDDADQTTSDSFVVTVAAPTPNNTAPTISSIANQTTAQNTLTSPLAFTVADAQTAPGSLAVTASSSNPALLPNGNIVLGGAGANRTVRLTPAANQAGTVTVTLTVTDGALSATSSFSLTVTAPANTPPTLSLVPNQSTTVGASLTVSFTVGDAQTAVGSLVVTASASNPSLLPASGLVLGGSGANRSLTLTPAANQVGTATVTLGVSDGALSTSRAFTLTVNPSEPTQLVSLPIEAEAGALATPMAASGTTVRAISSPTPEQGSATYSVQIPIPGAYTIWARVLAPSGDSDSFYVSLDGSEDIYDLTESKWSPNWQWTQVNGRAGATPLTLNPRIFNLAAGNHTLVFRGREVGASIDRFIITNDPDFVPSDPANTPPTISALSAQSTPENTAKAISFTVGDAQSALTSLTLSATSSNPTLVPSANIVFGGSGASRTATITPASGQYGSATITLTVSDGAATSSQSFALTVTHLNTPPTLSPIGAQSVQENKSLPLTFTVADQETDAASLLVTAISSNPTLLPNGNIVITGSGATRTASITPAPGQYGSANITVTVNDGAVSASQSFTLTVTHLNAPPTISGITGVQSVRRDAPLVIPFSVNDAETPTANLTITATSFNTALIANSGLNLGGSGPNRSLTITPVSLQSGTALIGLSVSDGIAAVTQNFTVNVENVNAPPTLSSIADQSTRESSSISVTFTVGDSETPLQNLILSSGSSNPTLIPNNNISFAGSGAQRTATLAPIAGRSGTATLTLSVNDGALTTSRSFVLSVNATNALPTLSAISPQSTIEDVPKTVAFTVADRETAAAQLTVTANSSNPALVPNSNIIISPFAGPGANRRATINPLARQSGTAAITLTVHDGSATASQTFVLTVAHVNHAPVPGPALFTTAESTPLVISIDTLLARASDPDAGDQVTLSQLGATSTQGGTLSRAKGAIIYTSPAGFTGQDSFTYTLSDQVGGQATGTVQATVTPKAQQDQRLTLSVRPGYNLITDPFTRGGNLMSEILPNMPAGTMFYKFDNQTHDYQVNTYEFGQWSNPSDTLRPGEGGFLYNPASWSFSVTFVGQTNATTVQSYDTAGFYVIGSQSLQPGLLTQVVNQEFADGDRVYRFNPETDSYTIHSNTLGIWDDEPTLTPGEAVFIQLVPR